MKHLKKLFENKESTKEELQDIFLPFEDQGFEINIKEITIFSNRRYFQELGNEYYIAQEPVSDLDVNDYDEYAYWYTGYLILLYNPELNLDESEFLVKVTRQNENYGSLVNLFCYDDSNLEQNMKSIDFDLNSLNHEINEINITNDRLKRSKLLLDRVEKLFTRFGFKKFDLNLEDDEDWFNDHEFNFAFALAKKQTANEIKKS